MPDSRSSTRLEEGIDVFITVLSDKRKSREEKIIYNSIKDFSATGVNIQTNVPLPVDTLLNVKFKLKTMKESINAVGKVKWVRAIMEGKYYETGVEFVNVPVFTLQKIQEYIDWKKKNEKPKSALSILIRKQLEKD